MSDRAYRDLYFDDPHVQAEFERLVQAVRDAEQARKPLGTRQRQVEQDNEAGHASEKDLRTAEDAYTAASNAIAAAQHAVDEFLHIHRNYRSR